MGIQSLSIMNIYNDPQVDFNSYISIEPLVAIDSVQYKEDPYGSPEKRILQKRTKKSTYCPSNVGLALTEGALKVGGMTK